VYNALKDHVGRIARLKVVAEAEDAVARVVLCHILGTEPKASHGGGTDTKAEEAEEAVPAGPLSNAVQGLPTLTVQASDALGEAHGIALFPRLRDLGVLIPTDLLTVAGVDLSWYVCVYYHT
jgi:hypothetical protein